MTRYWFLANSIIFLFSCSTPKNLQAIFHQEIKDSLTTELNEVYMQRQFNGFSVAIVNEQGTVYENGIGYSNVALQQKYDENTLQNIASISKTLVGIALLKAQELGKLKLDDPINKYLPFKVENPLYPDAKITLRHLATHTSTITDNPYYLKRNYVLKPWQDLKNRKLVLEDEQVLNPYDSLISLKAYLQNVLSSNGKWYNKEDFLKHRPGEIFKYSNVATGLAAYIIEIATGEDFDSFTAKHILKPLRMSSSGWKFADIDFSKYSTLYQYPDTALAFYSLITYPDGNFITSSHDLAKFLTELIKGYAGEGTLLNRDSYKEYFREQLTASNYTKRNDRNPYSDEYNIGIFIGSSVAGNIGHTGGDPGVSSIMFFNPKTKTGRLMIINTNINDKKGNDEFYNLWDKLGKYETKIF